MPCVETSTVFVLSLIFSIFVDSLLAVDLGGWGTLKTIPSSYFKISIQNILRCEKLCDRQGKCVAVMFDKLERMCYMHDIDQVPLLEDIENTTKGRYLFKKYLTGQKSRSDCDGDTQIAVPSALREHGACYDIEDDVSTAETTQTTPSDDVSTEETTQTSPSDVVSTKETTQTTPSGLVGDTCDVPADCTALYSDCTGEVCRCPDGLHGHDGATRCEIGCTDYGNSFTAFSGMISSHEEVYSFTPSSEDTCKQRCIAEKNFVCVSYCYDWDECWLQKLRTASNKFVLTYMYRSYTYNYRECLTTN